MVNALFHQPLPAWVVLAGFAVMMTLRNRLGAAERIIARHERRFARLSHWADGIDRSLGRAPAQCPGRMARGTGGKVIPFPPRDQF